jgi:hypothetical protein
MQGRVVGTPATYSRGPSFSPLSEGGSRSSNQEFSCLLWKPKFRYRIQVSTADCNGHYHIMRFKTHFNIFFLRRGLSSSISLHDCGVKFFRSQTILWNI